jgi:hypothetical protein
MQARNGDIHASGHTCRVIADHQASFPAALVFQAGDVLTVENRETVWEGWIWCISREGVGAWVPEGFVKKQGDSCIALRTYDSTELTVTVGDVLQACEEAGGWLWCTDGKGRWGWVPASSVEPYATA